MKKKLISMLLALSIMMTLVAPGAMAADIVPLHPFTPIPVNTDISNINGGERVIFAHLNGYYYKFSRNAKRPTDDIPTDGIVRYKADGTGGETTLAYNLASNNTNNGFIIYKDYLYYLFDDGNYNGGVSDGSDPNGSHTAIMRVSLDGKNRKTILKVYPYLQNLVIWKGRMTFNTMEGLISTNMEGGDKKILSSQVGMTVKSTPTGFVVFTAPSGAALDRSTGYLYWPGGAGGPGFYRTMYDGSTQIEEVSPVLKDQTSYEIFFCANGQFLFKGVTALLFDGTSVKTVNPDNRARLRTDWGTRDMFSGYYCGRFYYHDLYGRLASCLPDGTQKQLLTTGECCAAGSGGAVGVADNGVVFCVSRKGTVDLSNGVGGYNPPSGLEGSKYELVTELKTGMEVYFSPDATGNLRIGGASSAKVGLVPIISPKGEKFRLVSGKDNTFYIQSTKTNLYLTRTKEEAVHIIQGKSLSYQKKQNDNAQRFVFTPSGNGAFYFETMSGSVISCKNEPSAKLYHASPFSSWCLLVESTSAAATPSSTKLTMNGTPVSVDTYLIGENNYIKLRDLAYIVNGTSKNFNVSWDGTKNAINLMANTPYTVIDGDMSGGDGQAKTAKQAASKIFVNGVEKSMSAYLIGQNNYFKLRDVMEVFDINVGYDGTTGTASLDTNKSY